jgi:hypothetical protein
MIYIFIFDHSVMVCLVVVVVVAVAVLEVGYLVRLPLFGLFYQPRMIDDDDCGAVSGMSGR